MAPTKTETPAAASDDDIIVERLRRAGALAIGTNVMPGMGISSLSPHAASAFLDAFPRPERPPVS